MSKAWEIKACYFLCILFTEAVTKTSAVSRRGEMDSISWWRADGARNATEPFCTVQLTVFFFFEPVLCLAALNRMHYWHFVLDKSLFGGWGSGAVLCILGYLAASLASASRSHPVRTKNVSRCCKMSPSERKSPSVKNHHLGGWVFFFLSVHLSSEELLKNKQTHKKPRPCSRIKSESLWVRYGIGISFLAVPVACGSFWARDRTYTTTVTQVTAVTTQILNP